jgi:hypothetical protein
MDIASLLLTPRRGDPVWEMRGRDSGVLDGRSGGRDDRGPCIGARILRIRDSRCLQSRRAGEFVAVAGFEVDAKEGLTAQL